MAKTIKSNAEIMESTPNAVPVTYAIDGLTEYLLRIPVANTHIEFHFTGGLLSGYGVRPATLTLDDPVSMRYLEASPAFRKGLIRKT
ncbi:MAG: hypothetical protein HDS25_00315 [Bacteroides sp.]|nr:hypothetical protein [Bacteroides sp.]MDE6234359.1 hypothetical protein [Muribaculaceae bacterium]